MKAAVYKGPKQLPLTAAPDAYARFDSTPQSGYTKVVLKPGLAA